MAWKTEKSVRIAEETREGVSKRDLPIDVPPVLHEVLHHLASQGHKGLIVGGAVRDALMGQRPKDLDVECYGPSYDELSKTLSEHGKVNVVGAAFGVAKLRDKDGNDFDFTLPRRDSKSGIGHQDFDIEVDHTIHPKEAAARRDYSINSMAWDPLTKELHDYHGGEQDLKDRVLRHTSDAFSEDPLRVLRGMQFSARFGMKVHPDTAKLSQSIAHEYSTIPKERVSEEWMKMTKGSHPGNAIHYLKDTGWHENFPELHAMYGVKQDAEWHPEGDLEHHVAHSMNAAAKIADREGRTGDDRAVTVFSAMLHDVGKPVATQTDGDKITSYGHEDAGVPIAHQFLDSIGVKADISKKVGPLVREHMQHLNYEKNISSRTVRRLAQRVAPASIKELSHVMEADISGRPPLEGGLPTGAQKMLDKAEESHVTEKPMNKIVNGRDVLPYFPDVRPGPHIGEVVNDAFEAQLNGEINTPEEGKAWLERRFSPNEPPPPKTSAKMYHVVHNDILDQSLRHGLQGAQEEDGEYVYLFPHREHAESWADDHEGDMSILQVDVPGEVEQDPYMGVARRFKGDIGPEHIKMAAPIVHYCGKCEGKGTRVDPSFIHEYEADMDRPLMDYGRLCKHCTFAADSDFHDTRNACNYCNGSGLSSIREGKTSTKDAAWSTCAACLGSGEPQMGNPEQTDADRRCIGCNGAGLVPFQTSGKNATHHQCPNCGLLHELDAPEWQTPHVQCDCGSFWDDPRLPPRTASWRDVRNKAVRLRNNNLVEIIRLDPDVIASRVQGDHHTYDVVLYRQYPDSWSITMWECSCKWGDWAFKRQVTYVGRFCSHALATLYAAHGKEYQKTGIVTASSDEANYMKCQECRGKGLVWDDCHCTFNRDFKPDPNCPNCKGKGAAYTDSKCVWCHGSGLAPSCVTCGGQGWRTDKGEEWTHPFKPRGKQKNFPKHEFRVAALESEHVDYPANWDPSPGSDIGKWQHGTLPTSYVRDIALKNEPDLQTNRYYSDQEFEDFKSDIKKNGIQNPLLIMVNDDRDVVKNHRPKIQIEGHHRLLVAHQLGMDEVPVEVRYFGTTHKDGMDLFRKTGRLGNAKLTFYGFSRPVTITVEVATDMRDIMQGLMGRTYLAPRSGMVFKYQSPPSYSSFWMKNTLLPLSIAFWDRQGRIIEVKDMEPCPPGATNCPMYSCSQPYWGAVEVNRGFFRLNGIGPGTRIELLQ